MTCSNLVDLEKRKALAVPQARILYKIIFYHSTIVGKPSRDWDGVTSCTDHIWELLSLAATFGLTFSSRSSSGIAGRREL